MRGNSVSVVGRSAIPPYRERLYRLMRRVGIGTLLIWCFGGVLLGSAWAAVGVTLGVLGMLLSLYLIFGFSHVNEWLHRRKSG